MWYYDLQSNKDEVLQLSYLYYANLNLAKYSTIMDLEHYSYFLYAPQHNLLFHKLQ